MIDKYLDHAGKLKEMGNITVTVIPVALGSHGMVIKSLERVGNKRKNQGHLNYYIVKIG